jgi:peroxiredoxin
MKKSIFSVLLFFVILNLQAQQSVTVKMPVADTSKYVTLAHYHGYKQFLKVDSAKVKDGLLHFKSNDNTWKSGVYLVVTSPSKFYDFLLSGNEKDIYMEFDTSDYTSTVKFRNSPENEYLFGYRRHLNEVSKSAVSLQEQLKTETDPAKVNAARTKLGGLQKEVNADLKKRAAAQPSYFASKVMLANLEPELPDTPPILANGRPDSTFFYRTYKKHFFDNLDFGDDRMIRTPFLESKLEKYFTNLVYQRTDSLKKETDYVLRLASKNKDVYRYALWYLTNKYENTDVVGLDGTVVHLYENHYLKNGDWLDSTQRARFVERLAIMKPIETGKVMPPLTLKDAAGKAHNLYDVKAKYTIVYFYSPTCGHCKDSAPALVKFQDENRSKGIEVWNISSDPERDLNEMNNFIKTYDTGRMANLYDADRRYDFRNRYDVYSTPTLYILDDKKRILAKRIPVEDINKYLEHYENGLK